ncbi:hypothetical protein llap_9965 [Limosa lapponica baueri]|uniref:Uncharacterized protein n=1 Tax=Limosa lapponica baueri TaxID=1758121 RepID=A0A2I0U131_LIMLA|nr:hypothetical protein llap_9965 [Limosa lapponica baueri]
MGKIKMEQEWDQEREQRKDGEEEKFEMETMKMEYDFQRERIRVNEGPTGSAHAYLVSYNKCYFAGTESPSRVGRSLNWDSRDVYSTLGAIFNILDK